MPRQRPGAPASPVVVVAAPRSMNEIASQEQVAGNTRVKPTTSALIRTTAHHEESDDKQWHREREQSAAERPHPLESSVRRRRGRVHMSVAERLRLVAGALKQRVVDVASSDDDDERSFGVERLQGGEGRARCRLDYQAGVGTANQSGGDRSLGDADESIDGGRQPLELAQTPIAP